MTHYIGQRFGRYVVISETQKQGKNYYVECLCDCGNRRMVQIGALKNGSAQSCGCLNRDIITKHGLDGNPIYHVLNTMKHRCYSIKNKSYENYGGRGIKICEEWLDNPESFVEWATQNGYCKGLTIDRIDNNGDYSPENCRWVDRKVQALNTRHNTVIKYNGESKTLCEWADEYNLKPSTLCYRIYTAGWDFKRSITAPIRRKSVETIPTGSTFAIDTQVEAEN